MDIYEIRNELNGKTIFELPLRVTYYARVSTDKDAQLHSLSAQVQYYSELIRKSPSWRFVEGYVDEGISGTSTDKRESFLRMIDDARSGRFDFIITKEISRFSRNTLDSIRYTQELLRYGVGVLFQSDNINTLMPDAELRLTIMSSIAQDEVRKISERVKFGFKRAIEKGTVLGSDRIWGYRKQGGRLVIQEEEAELVRTIFDLYANQQLGIRRVAGRLTDLGYRNSNGNALSFSTIRGILRNPKYKGYYCGGKSSKVDHKLKKVKNFTPDQWVIYKDEVNVPPIVSEAVWEKANQLLDRRSAKQSAEDRTSYQNKYPYSGKVFCGLHREPYYRSLYHYKSGDREVWRCREYVRDGKRGCASPPIYTAELDDMVRQSLWELPLEKEEIVHDLIRIYTGLTGGAKIEEELAKCRAAVDGVLRRKDKLLDLNIDGRISDEELALRNGRFNEELEKLRAQLRELEEERRKEREMAERMEGLTEAVTRELAFPGGFSIGLIDALLDRAEVFGTGSGDLLRVKLYLKGGPDELEYTVRRVRGGASVCTRRYI